MLKADIGGLGLSMHTRGLQLCHLAPLVHAGSQRATTVPQAQLQMADSHDHTLLSVVELHAGTTALHRDGSIVPPETCRRSEILQDLLDTVGDAALPIPQQQFQAWLDFANACTAGNVSGPSRRARLAQCASLFEVCHTIRLQPLQNA